VDDSKAKLRLIFPHLNDEDLQYDYVGKEVMMEKLQEKLRRSRDELDLLLLGL